MITKEVIKEIYKKYNKRPASADELDIALLFEHLIDSHDIAIDDDANLIINSIPIESPFHTIPLAHIHAILEFSDKIAVVLHSSIVFLNKYNNKVHIHIKQDRLGLIDRLRANMSKD